MKKSSLTLILSIALLAGACTTTRGGGNLQYAVNENTNAIRQLQAQVSNMQPAQADSWSQLQALHREMSALQGLWIICKTVLPI